MAFSPGFFETAIVTAGEMPLNSMPFCDAAAAARRKSRTAPAGRRRTSRPRRPAGRRAGRRAPRRSAARRPRARRGTAPACTRHDACVGHERSRVLHDVRRLQRRREVGDVRPWPASRCGVQRTCTVSSGPADRVDVARAGHALQFGFDGVRDLLQLVARRAASSFVHSVRLMIGHVVDALRLHERLARCRRPAAASPGSSRSRSRAARSRPCVPRRPRTAP